MPDYGLTYEIPIALPPTPCPLERQKSHEYMHQLVTSEGWPQLYANWEPLPDIHAGKIVGPGKDDALPLRYPGEYYNALKFIDEALSNMGFERHGSLWRRPTYFAHAGLLLAEDADSSDEMDVC